MQAGTTPALSTCAGKLTFCSVPPTARIMARAKSFSCLLWTIGNGDFALISKSAKTTSTVAESTPVVRRWLEVAAWQRTSAAVDAPGPPCRRVEWAESPSPSSTRIWCGNTPGWAGAKTRPKTVDIARWMLRAGWSDRLRRQDGQQHNVEFERMDVAGLRSLRFDTGCRFADIHVNAR